MNIAIVGAGNIGLTMASYISLDPKNKVTVFTSKNLLENKQLILRDVEDHKEITINNINISDDPKNTFGDTDIIFCTYPAFLRKKFIQENEKYIVKSTILCFVPGYGGAEYFCKKLLDKGVVIAGFQRVPYVARSERKDHEVIANILSKKKTLYVAAIPKKETIGVKEIIEKLLHIPVDPLHEYLAITLAPSNPLLHLSGLYNVFKDYKDGEHFDKQLMFYEEWNDETSQLLFDYDKELQDICDHLGSLDLHEVVPLPVYYESPTPEKMTKKLKSIEAFKAVKVPLIQNNEGYIPDFNSRMFIEDFPYGICVIKDFALMANIMTPTIDRLLKFYEELSGHEYFDLEHDSYGKEINDTGIPGVHGFTSIEQIEDFYRGE